MGLKKILHGAGFRKSENQWENCVWEQYVLESLDFVPYLIQILDIAVGPTLTFGSVYCFILDLLVRLFE